MAKEKKVYTEIDMKRERAYNYFKGLEEGEKKSLKKILDALGVMSSKEVYQAIEDGPTND